MIRFGAQPTATGATAHIGTDYHGAVGVDHPVAAGRSFYCEPKGWRRRTDAHIRICAPIESLDLSKHEAVALRDFGVIANRRRVGEVSCARAGERAQEGTLGSGQHLCGGIANGGVVVLSRVVGAGALSDEGVAASADITFAGVFSDKRVVSPAEVLEAGLRSQERAIAPALIGFACTHPKECVEGPVDVAKAGLVTKEGVTDAGVQWGGTLAREKIELPGIAQHPNAANVVLQHRIYCVGRKYSA